MFTKLKTMNSFTIAVALALALGGVVYAVTQVTRDVSATVNVQVSTPNGIEIYLDANLTLPANNIAFGTVVVDPFGTPPGQPASPVPVWVENQSSSAIELTLIDDFALGDVLLAGPNQAPILQPGEVLPVELMLEFNQGVEGSHPFTMTFQAEGPVDTPTPSPVPTATPAKDTLIFVTSEEPTTIGAASPNCGGNIQNTICDDMVSDPLTWIDDRNNFQVVGLTGIEGWEQIDPNRWRFHLRDGVTFHNGAPWNAPQAKFWIDYFGDEGTSGHSNSNDFSFHGVIAGEVVDDRTLDVVCQVPCPILPRTTIFTKFQDVGWFETASQEEKERMTVGLGPYKIVEWRAGQEVELEEFVEYHPNPNTVFSWAPSIQRVFQIWRNESAVRAAMLAAGEADWAEVSREDRGQVPKWKAASNNEVYIYSIDTVHHPELSKRAVREALNLAIDCETLMQALFGNLLQCYGNTAQPGTVGITPQNSAGYPYDPDQARQLLAGANYDPNNVITLTTRSGRVPKDVEYAEAVVTFWREVGINAELQVVEPSVRADISRSNCGHQRTQEDFDNAPGDDLHEKCRSLGPGPPTFASMQVVEAATSTESLDYSRQALLRNSCFSRVSGVCFSDLEAMINEAVATPNGDLRRQRLEAIANRVHDDFYFVPNFQVVSIYGLSEFLDWEPYYSPRLRVNTMRFSN